MSEKSETESEIERDLEGIGKIILLKKNHRYKQLKKLFTVQTLDMIIFYIYVLMLNHKD